jgi:hypothetical protein
MLSNSSEIEGTATGKAWFLHRVAFPLVLALLALGFVGMSTAMASSSVSLRPSVVSRQSADATPALIAYNATTYIGWTGRNAAHNLNLMTYTPSNQAFSSAIVLTDTTLVGEGPSLAIFNGNLAVSWIGTHHRLNVGLFKPGDPTHLANKVTLSEYSNDAPSIVTFNGRLYLSWRGTDGRLNIISSADAHTFNTKVTYNISIRTSSTLQTSNSVLFVAWEDITVASHITFAQYNPSNPAVLNAQITTTSLSLVPVALFTAGTANPYLRVAWTDASTNINLGIFEGDQTLHNVVKTTQTSVYGPALYMPYLSWTGRDAAQSVNILQVSF